jgi:diacylglycerol kinase (ATP)
MRVVVIINPIAGWGRRRPSAGSAARDVARAWITARGLDGDVAVTTSRGHGALIARDAVLGGADRVVAWGGDGTVNEVAGPLIGSPTVLGIVRAGSGDGLARGLGLPSEATEALDVAVSEGPIPLDVGWLGRRHFLNVGGFGFDAAVAQAFNDQTARGLAGYLAAGARSLLAYRCPSYHLRLDDASIEGPQFLVAFANSREYGNGFTIAPDADPTDGLLDAVVVGGGSVTQHVWRGWRMYTTPRAKVAGILRRRVARATIAAEPLLAHVDGEAFEADGPVTVSVQAGALRVATPQPGSPRRGEG